MAYVTDSKRKEPYSWEGNYFSFETKYDLSGGINVSVVKHHTVARINEIIKNKELLAADITCFIAEFMIYHYETLNGFSGFDTIKWKFNF